MAENRKQVFAGTVASILLACLLGAVVYYYPIGDVKPKVAFAFVLEAADQVPSDPEYDNHTFLHRFFEMKFGLKNGSTIIDGGVGLHFPKGVCWGGLKPEYQGEFAALVQDIEATLWSYSTAPWGYTEGIGAHTDLGTVANVSTTQNVTISSSLATATIIDMGICRFIYGPEAWDTYSTKHWNIPFHPLAKKVVTNRPRWNISSTELLRHLEGSGTATIAFDATFNVHVNYTVTLGNKTETGEKDLFWEGRLGTIEVTYDETSIFEVRYHFIRVDFLLLTLKQ